MSIISKDIQNHWIIISHLFTIRSESEYEEAIERLNSLIDEVGTNEQHPLYGLLDILGTVIHAYEEKHYPMPECSSSDILRFFMEEHDLNESDLTEIGSRDMVSKVLSGELELTTKQIRNLAKRFNVSPAAFI